jgi:hypothetical protein
MEGVRGPLMLWSNIPPPVCESWPRARVMCVPSEQQGRWKLLRAVELMRGRVGLNPGPQP